MPRSVIQHNLLISCPGDIQSEIKLIDQAVEEFNELFSDTTGISIRTKHWSKSSYAQSGGKPQELLNKQFVEDCDAAVALLWTRFGTPTDKYGSGTEEEIEIMLNAGKQVFMYFSDKPIQPSNQNPQEYERVKSFREKYKDRGVFSTYSSDKEFSKIFFAHLSQHFLSAKSVAELKEKRAPQLVLRGIDEMGTLCEHALIQPFKLPYEHSVEKYKAQIAQMYQEISRLYLGQRVVEADDSLLSSFIGSKLPSFYKPITIEDNKKEFLIQIAQQLEIELPEDFFNLGNLSKNTIQSMVTPVGSNLDGTEDEKQKYNLIEMLYETIVECAKWIPIEEAYSVKKCVKFAVENSGTAIDEDIEVTVIIDKQILLPFNQFPPLKNDSKEFLINEYKLSSLFGIRGTVQYSDYDSAMKTGFNPSPTTNLPSYPFLAYETDYSDAFEEALRDVFGYDVYSDEQNYILKLKFDYIKHHTTVAFPTAIFLKDVPSAIAYKISSRNSADVICGNISVFQ